jgi:asparagine synthase (glutamine-hydrolysing)
MCGITGFIELKRDDSAKIGQSMAEVLQQRGPDDAGVWSDEAVGVVLAHRRLSVLDLTAAGHQPMQSLRGRYSIVFNGEIYNHLCLRTELGEHPWRGRSDTETLLVAIETWGIENALKNVIGMFAIAIWDRDREELTLARDRLGEKPLFYGWQGSAFLFGSELKALKMHPAWHAQINRDALAAYMRYGYVPSPHSIYEGIQKLLPGSYLTIKASLPKAAQVDAKFYWSIPTQLQATNNLQLSDDEAIQTLDTLLTQAVGSQMLADVPLGAFLSGGIDSSTVVALMQAQSARPIKTFSIGFNDSTYDEAPYAKKVAAHLGTDHTELYVSSTDALSVIPQLPQIYDEPFGDSSQIPTYLVARMARQHVTVSLSGDGGDELFGGYNRYSWGPSTWNAIGMLPQVARTAVARGIELISPTQWDRLSQVMPKALRFSAFGDKVHKFASVLDSSDFDELYRRLVTQQRETKSIVLNSKEFSSWADSLTPSFREFDLPERMMFRDLLGYLQDDILVKVDRASMAVSLEARVPFLDRRVVEFALAQPPRMKIRNGQGKWILRKVLDRYMPRELVERPKQGFGVPLETWLRGPLREWAEQLINKDRLYREGFLDVKAIHIKWEEHLSGRRNWQHWLWNVLMFQAWLEKQQS